MRVLTTSHAAFQTYLIIRDFAPSAKRGAETTSADGLEEESEASRLPLSMVQRVKLSCFYCVQIRDGMVCILPEVRHK